MINFIIPYRNRREQLLPFLTTLPKYLEKNQISEYKIFIIEQNNDNLFNRGCLLNIGFLFSFNDENDLLVLHDIDQLPIKVNYLNYKENFINLLNPIQAGSNNIWFSNVTSLKAKHFIDCNGFSNTYEGWGFEDNDFYSRLNCKSINKNIILDNKFYSMSHIHNGFVDGKPNNIALNNYNNFISKNFSYYQKEGLSSVNIKSYKINSIKDKIFNILVDF